MLPFMSRVTSCAVESSRELRLGCTSVFLPGDLTSFKIVLSRVFLTWITSPVIQIRLCLWWNRKQPHNTHSNISTTRIIPSLSQGFSYRCKLKGLVQQLVIFSYSLSCEEEDEKNSTRTSSELVKSYYFPWLIIHSFCVKGKNDLFSLLTTFCLTLRPDGPLKNLLIPVGPHQSVYM